MAPARLAFERPIAIACFGLRVLSFPLFIWRISLPTISWAFGPYLRPRARAVREPVDERAVFGVEEPLADFAERRLEEVLLREPAVVARRVRVAVAVRRVRERPLADLVARVE